MCTIMKDQYFKLQLTMGGFDCFIIRYGMFSAHLSAIWENSALIQWAAFSNIA